MISLIPFQQPTWQASQNALLANLITLITAVNTLILDVQALDASAITTGTIAVARLPAAVVNPPVISVTSPSCYLGGSAIEAVRSASTSVWVPLDGTAANPGLQVVLNPSARSTPNFTVTIQLRAASGSVTARLRDITNNIVVATSLPITSTTFATTTFAGTLTAGNAAYLIELLPSVANSDVAGIAYGQ